MVWALTEDRVAGQIVVSKEIASNGVTAKAIAAVLGEKLGVRGGGRDTSAQVGGKIDKSLEEIVQETWSVLKTLMEADS